ncbi:uncharacterized protein LOC134179762 [Corticium candelabrum]|uniref:uncharacterized protein LOC134179762 n=1 Tax=Corticium candelabrum TaxID=121492 RepID=UPI002E27751C|nr:uncharacterized protein LOC134179762 [Corticium candelabrum]
MARFEWPSFFPSLSPSLVDMPWLIKWNDTCSEVTVAEQEKEYTAMCDALANQGHDDIPIGQTRSGADTPETYSITGEADEEINGEEDTDVEIDDDIADFDVESDDDVEVAMTDGVINELPPW